jgi:heptosyltransferase-1
MRALIVRLGSIGDIVHAMPLVPAVRSRHPGAEIDWVVEAALADTVRLCAGISRIVPFETRRAGGARGWFRGLRSLRAARYDVALDAQGLLKSALVARLSGARRVIGWSRRWLREPAAEMLYSERVEATGATHVLDKNLALLRALDIDVDRVSRDVQLVSWPESSAVAEAIGAVGERFAVINPGANWPNKRWPPDRFGELAARVHATQGLRSLVLWGPGDETLADAVAVASRGAARRAPATSLRDIADLARRAAVVITGDTGPLHLACAAGARTVGIFGPTDPARNGSWRPGDEAVSRFEACACHHQRACRAARWCLPDVSVDEVEAAVARRLSGQA